jgi:hypothetical protein
MRRAREKGRASRHRETPPNKTRDRLTKALREPNRPSSRASFPPGSSIREVIISQVAVFWVALIGVCTLAQRRSRRSCSEMTSAECGNAIGSAPGPQATTRLRICGSPARSILSAKRSVSRDWVASPRRTAATFGRPAPTTETCRPCPESDRTQQAAATPSPRTRTVSFIWKHPGTNRLLPRCYAQAASGPCETHCRSFSKSHR